MGDYQVMPPLSVEEYEKLKADITANGVLVPVVRDQNGNLLDGHHRAQVADELGVTYRVDVVEVRDDEHALSLARMYNLARRHLTREQKRQLIADEIRADPDRSDRSIARLIGVDHKTVGSVRRELSGEIPQPEHNASDVSVKDAKEHTARILAGLDRIDATVIYLLSNRVDKYRVASFLQDGLARIEKLCNDAEFIEPVRRHVFYPRIQFVLVHGDEVTEEHAGPDICRKPLTEADIERLAGQLGGVARD